MLNTEFSWKPDGTAPNAQQCKTQWLEKNNVVVSQVTLWATHPRAPKSFCLPSPIPSVKGREEGDCRDLPNLPSDPGSQGERKLAIQVNPAERSRIRKEDHRGHSGRWRMHKRQYTYVESLIRVEGRSHDSGYAFPRYGKPR